MDNIQKKNLLKKKKRILHLINLVSDFDQVKISFEGEKKHKYSSLIKKSLENALSIKTILPPQILKMKGLSGRKFRIKELDNLFVPFILTFSILNSSA